MRALIDSNDTFAPIMWIKVDWDMHRSDKIVEELKVPRRSTLITFKGGKEVGRVVAQTTPIAIEPILQAAI